MVCRAARARQPMMLSQLGLQAHSVDLHRPRNVLELLLAYVLESVIEPVSHLVPNDTADADPARLRQCLQPRSDVDPVPKDVVLFDDHVTKVHPDAKPDAPLLRHVGLAVSHPTLHLARAAHRIHNTWKFREQAVAGVLYDTPAMFVDLRLD